MQHLLALLGGQQPKLACYELLQDVGLATTTALLPGLSIRGKGSRRTAEPVQHACRWAAALPRGCRGSSWSSIREVANLPCLGGLWQPWAAAAWDGAVS